MARKVVKIIRSHTEYEPICELLEMAIHHHDNFHDESLTAIVRDAKIIAKDGSKIYTVERSVVRYSSRLSEYPRRELEKLDPNDMSIEELRSILRFFRR